MKYRLSFVLSLIFVLVFVISAPLSASAFSDVDDNSWYADAVDYCYEKGYFAGTSATTFSPDLPMDRSMLVTVLHRREGTPQPTAPASFSDVPADTWYSEAVAWAAEEKIVSGYEDGTFRPEKPITRQEIMSLFQRYVVYLGEDASSEDLRIFNSFLDCSLVGEWATPAAQWCTSVGIICGSNGYISPTSSSTRAQIASILMRLDSYLDGKMQTITSTYGEGGTMVPLGTFQIVENSSISFRVTADQGWIQKTATLNGTTLTNQQIYTVYGKDNPQTIVVTFRKLAGDPYSGYGQLVNRSYPIPNASSYKPSDLKTVAYGNVQLRAEAANALNRMIADYRAENPGSTLYAQSGYRSNSTQVYLYNRQINRQGGNVYKAGTISAVPGTS
ncbi:MAG: S-layer homology domain-containing protein, partial [Firmicutes bacterium]|nr:S-layer homology domain-containing protein [Bacillota bacterium]